MADIITSAACLSCRSCCKFDEADRYFGPVLSRTEKDTIVAAYGMTEDHFEPIDGGEDLFRIILVPHDGQYVCPFYDPVTTRCGVYARRPIDCSLWPIMIVKTGDPMVLGITVSQKQYCPSLDRATETDLRKYYAAAVRLLGTTPYITHFRHYPGLAWTHEEDWMIPIGTIDLRAGTASETPPMRDNAPVTT